MATQTTHYGLIKPIGGEKAKISDINLNSDTIDELIYNTQQNLAAEYDNTTTSENPYNIGDIVIYNTLLYKCNTDNTYGTWNPAKWDNIKVIECGVDATDINYDNTESGLTAENVQDAIDELADAATDVEVTQIQTEGKAVASIAVDGVSTDILVPELKVYGEASGDLITIEDAMEAPLEECKVTLEPQQDLHGYDSPWVGGAGKNKLEVTAQSQTNNGITYTVNEDGTITAIGTATASSVFIVTNNANVGAGDYIVNGCPQGGASSTYRLYFEYNDGSSVNGQIDTGTGKTVNNVTSIGRVLIQIYPAAGNVNLTFKPMIRLATETDATFASYENICPISGWDEVKVNVSPTQDAEDGTTYTIQLGSTCYGGELDVKSGVLKIINQIETYNGSENWTEGSTGIYGRSIRDYNELVMCNRFKAILPKGSSTELNDGECRINATARYINFKLTNITSVEDWKSWLSTNNIEVVYELATPQEIQLTPTEVTLLLGINNLWSDGEMYAKYRRDIEILLQRIADSLGGSNASSTRPMTKSISMEAKQKETKTESTEEIIENTENEEMDIIK